MTLAIFDLDETLISIDSDHEWGEFLIEKGLVDPIDHRTRNDAFYAQYQRGQLDIFAYLEFSSAFLAQKSPADLERLREEYVDTKIRPRMLPQAVQLVESHRRRGHKPIIITSTIEFITRPIATAFGIETLIAPEPELVNGRYTGKIKGVPSFAEGKVTRLDEWLQLTNLDLKGSFFYSDSRNDLPLLRRVDHPVAVDPDPILTEEANKAGWSIISLRA